MYTRHTTQTTQNLHKRPVEATTVLVHEHAGEALLFLPYVEQPLEQSYCIRGGHAVGHAHRETPVELRAKQTGVHVEETIHLEQAYSLMETKRRKEMEEEMRVRA